MEEKKDKIIVAYWEIRGLGAPLRMICEYANAPYEAVTYPLKGSPGNWDNSSWMDFKPTLKAKNPLINLPYVIDGNHIVTQSNACFYYLGRKFNLNGKNEEEHIKNDQCLMQVVDMRNEAVYLFYSSPEEYSKKIDKYVDSDITKNYTKFEEWLAYNKTAYLVHNDGPATADFHLWEMLDQHEALAKSINRPNLFLGIGHESEPTKYPLLREYYKRFRALSSLQNYFSGHLYALPPNNKQAAFGSK